jgi:hypothetical protein
MSNESGVLLFGTIVQAQTRSGAAIRICGWRTDGKLAALTGTQSAETKYAGVGLTDIVEFEPAHLIEGLKQVRNMTASPGSQRDIDKKLNKLTARTPEQIKRYGVQVST